MGVFRVGIYGFKPQKLQLYCYKGIRPPFPASVVIFILLMLLHAKEVLINKKLG